MWKLIKINNRGTKTNVLVSLLFTLTTLTMLTIFTFCFRVFTTKFGQLNAGSYFNASIHRRSQQNMLLLNVNRINQTGFFQTYLHHSLAQWYPHSFHMIHLCTRHTQPYILNNVFDMNINLYDVHFFEVDLHFAANKFQYWFWTWLHVSFDWIQHLTYKRLPPFFRF